MKNILLLLALTLLSHAPLYADNTPTHKVAPAIPGIEWHDENGLLWLHFDADADRLWPMLKNFWAEQGMELDIVEPTLGYMQTEWSKDLFIERLRSIFNSDGEPERRDRFRLRVERLPNGKGANVFIHHSSYGVLLGDYAVYSGYLPPMPEIEAEMLARLAIFAGGDKAHFEKAASAFASREIRARRVSDSLYRITLPGTPDYIAKKVVRALDRMDIDSEQPDAHTLIARLSSQSDLQKGNDDGWDIDENSDLEAPGFDSETAPVKAGERIAYRLQLRARGNDTVIDIRAEVGNTDNGAHLPGFSRSLAANLGK